MSLVDKFRSKPIYRNIKSWENGKATFTEPVSKKEWKRGSGQVQRFKRSGEVKSTVTRSKHGTEREHEFGKWRYEKSEEGRKLFRI
jgi:hypothetical protein